MGNMRGLDLCQFCGSYLQLFIQWYVGEELVSVLYIVHPATIMLQSVADHEVINVQNQIISAYLVEHGLGDFHVGGFILHDHLCCEVPSVEHGVAPFLGVVQPQLHFVGHQCARVAFVFNQEMYEMLTYPFFRSQGHIASADEIEDGRAAILPDDFGLEGRQVE